MIVLEDKATWPTIHSLWSHRNGNTYRVLMFTNVASTKPQYPTTIVYMNTSNHKSYSRPLMDWDRSMTLVD